MFKLRDEWGAILKFFESTLKLNDIKFIIDSSNIKKFKLVLDNIFEDITFINNNNNKIIYKKNKINN